MAWSFQIFPVVSWSFLKQQGSPPSSWSPNILNMLKTSVARARRCQSASQSAQERIKNGIFVAHTELKRLQAAPIASAFRPIPNTLLQRCFRLQHDRLALGALQYSGLDIHYLLVCLFVCLFIFIPFQNKIYNTKYRTKISYISLKQ